MNRSTIIIVVFGFFFALLAAVAVQFVGGSNKQAATNTPVVEEKLTILVAARDIKAGENLDITDMAWTAWPKEAKIEGMIEREGNQAAKDALGGRVKRAVAKGEPLTKSVILEDEKTNFVAGTLKPGKRAVTIKVNAQSSVAGFVGAGDYVDVIMTYSVRLPKDDKIKRAALLVVGREASETILENLRVLAVDQNTTNATDPKVGKTVTLEVSPKEAEMAVLAAKMGNLSLVLRPLGEAQTNATKGPITTDMRVSGILRELTQGENKTSSSAQVVRVYSGSRVDNIEVRPSVTR